MAYNQLTEDQRYQIQALLAEGLNQSTIAERIGVHSSTISRELKRNKGQRGYRPKQANKKALQRRHESGKYTKLTPSLKKKIEHYLKMKWSPERISFYLREHSEEWVSHESVYRYVLLDKKEGGTLYRYLRYGGKRRKKALRQSRY